MKATLFPGAASLPRAVLHATLALLILAATSLHAAERVALVVGCGAYSKLHALDTPAQDAKTLAETLAAAPLGFECITVTDATLDAFYEGLEKFKVQARGAKVAVLYFSGHGIEHDGQNYLIPVDAVLDQASQLRSQAVNVGPIMEDLGRTGASVKLAILDCCRDNPFATTKSWSVTKSLRDQVLRDLGEAEIPQATLVCFATGAGRKAAARLDETSVRSPFTEALVKALKTPGLSLRDIFENVHDVLDQQTEGRQVPSVKTDNALSRIFRETVLVPGAGPARTAPPAVPAPEPPVVIFGLRKGTRLVGHYEYAGGYTWGPKPNSFSMQIAALDKDGNFTAHTSEPYSGFGVSKNGFLYADVSGNIRQEPNGAIALRWKKIYRGFENPVTHYSGTWAPRSGAMTGVWQLKDPSTGFVGDGRFSLRLDSDNAP